MDRFKAAFIGQNQTGGSQSLNKTAFAIGTSAIAAQV